MKQYAEQPDNSNWVDYSPRFDIILKCLFILCIVLVFISKCNPDVSILNH